MTKSAAYSKANDVFSQNVKKVFLKIPHVVEKVHEKINLITFRKEDVKDYYLSHIKMIEILEPLTEEEYKTIPSSIKPIFFECNYYDYKSTGIFIGSNAGYSCEALIKELMEVDEKNGINLWVNYLNYFANASDIVNVEEKLIRQIKQLKKYLIDENIRVVNLGVDLESISKLTDDEQNKIVTDLYDKYGSGYRFKAYNDLDYTPFVCGDDVYIYDSSGARLYIIRENKELDKLSVYQFNLDFMDIELSDMVNDFAYDHKQCYILYEKLIGDKYLIGEIENNKITKAGYSLTNFELIHSFIVDELYDEGEIKNTPLDLSFNELLENYTLQKEIYKIKERAFLKIFKDLYVTSDVLTYKGFSLMEKTGKLSNEDFTYANLDNLKKDIEDNKLLNFKKISEKYKIQIDEYLDELLKTYEDDNVEKIVIFIKGKLNGVKTSKKLS